MDKEALAKAAGAALASGALGRILFFVAILTSCSQLFNWPREKYHAKKS